METNPEQSLSTGSMEQEIYSSQTEPVGMRTRSSSNAPQPVGATLSLLDEGRLLFWEKSDDGKEEFYGRELEKNEVMVSFLWAMAQKHSVMLPDAVRKNRVAFVGMVMSPGTFFVSVNNIGVMYLTGIGEDEVAIMHYFFWDKIQRNRQKITLEGMRWAMDSFKLHRLECSIPYFATAALWRVRKMGFRLEGVMKEGMKYNGRWADLYLFGVLREELTLEVLETGKIQNDTSWYKIMQKDPRLVHKVLGRE